MSRYARRRTPEHAARTAARPAHGDDAPAPVILSAGAA